MSKEDQKITTKELGKIRRTSDEFSISEKDSMKQTEAMKKAFANDMAYSTENYLRHSRSLSIENFIGIWLDLNISQLNGNIPNYVDHLRQVINFFQIFTDLNHNIDYLNKVKNEKAFMIVSGSIGQIFTSHICDMTQVISVYIFCDDNVEYEQSTSRHKKVRGVFNRIETLRKELRADVHLSENALTPISVIPPSSTLHINKLDSAFMFSQLLKEILLEDPYDEQQKKNFVNFCRPHYIKNERELKMLGKFEGEYPHPSTVWWYTCECFLYRMLNKALRTQEIEQIIKMGFIIRDLHQHIKQLNSQQNHSRSFMVYRGQGIEQPAFDKINASKGGLLAFNNFLSTSIDREVSLKFARRARDLSNLTILFEMKIDFTRSIIPFASIDNVGFFGDKEKEILFSMHAVFRIEEIKQIESGLFQINLTLTNDNDRELTQLTEYMREVSQGQTRIRRLGSLMIAMAEFDKAEEIYGTLFDATFEYDKEERAFLHHQLGWVNWEKRDLVNALSHFQQCLNIYLTSLLSNDPQLSPIYTNIGTVLQEQGDLNGALKHLKLALDISVQALRYNEFNIDPHTLRSQQLNIATQHNNIGLVLDKQGKYDEALKSYDRALEIELVHLPPLHPLLATTYSNIGLIHRKSGNNLRALSYYQKTLEIFERSLPSNHPSLAYIHHNIAQVLNNLHRTHEAIEHAVQAVNIGQHALGFDHPQVKEYQQYHDKLREK